MPPASANVYTQPPYDYEAPYDYYDYGYADYDDASGALKERDVNGIVTRYRGHVLRQRSNPLTLSAKIPSTVFWRMGG